MAFGNSKAHCARLVRIFGQTLRISRTWVCCRVARLRNVVKVREHGETRSQAHPKLEIRRVCLPSVQRSLCLLLIYAHLYTTIGMSTAVASGRVHSFKIEEMSPEEVAQHLRHSRLGVISARDGPVRGLRLKLTEKPTEGDNTRKKEILFRNALFINSDGTFVMDAADSDLFKFKTTPGFDQANFMYLENGKTAFSLAIKPQGTTTLTKLKSTDCLKIKTCADIRLVNRLRGGSLGLSARNISNNAHLSLNGRLDVKASGKAGQKGTVLNLPEGIITTPRMTVYEGLLKNQGMLEGASKLTINLCGNSLTNEDIRGNRPVIKAPEGLEIIDGGKITNNGNISGQKTLKILTNVLENNHAIKSPALKLTAHMYVHNEGFLGSDDPQSALTVEAFCRFMNTGTLKAQMVRGYIQDLQNEGTFTSGESLDMALFKLLNLSIMTSGRFLSLATQSGDVFNSGLICAGDRVRIRAADGFQNYGTIKSAQGEVVFDATLRLQNYKEIRAKKVFVIAKEFENTGVGHGEDFFFADVEQARNEGLLTSDKELRIGTRGGLTAAGSWTNTGVMRSPAIEAAFSRFMNEGMIEGVSILDLAVQDGENTGDVIAGETLKLGVEGPFANLQTIRSLIQAHILVQGRLDNSGEISASDRLTFSGAGTTDNTGNAASQKAVILNQEHFHNRGSLASGGALELALGRTFHNHATGSVRAKGMTVVAGNARMINEGVSAIGSAFQDQGADKPGVTLEGPVTFRDFRGTLDNRGCWFNQAATQGAIADFQNRHMFASRGGYDLIIGKFLNGALLRGSGKLTLHEGTNAGVIDGEELTFNISGFLTHQETGILKTSSLKLLGQGAFTTEGMIAAPKFGSNIAGFTNKGRLDLTNPVFGESLQSWRNEGVFKAETLTFEAGRQALNVGTLEITGGLTSGVATFSNEGCVTAKKADFTGLLFKNAASGTLTLKRDSLFNVTALENDGDIVSESRISGEVVSLTNRNLIQTRGKIELTGRTFTNDGKIIGDQGVSYGGRELVATARSEMTTPETLSLTLASPLTNLGLLKGDAQMSLHAPAFINAGQCLSATATTLPADFTNQGTADLRQVNWVTAPGGKTILSNASGASLTLHDKSAWSGVTAFNNAGDMTVEASPFVLDQVTNTGALYLSGGAYHVKSAYVSGPHGRTVLEGTRARLSSYRETPRHVMLLNNEDTVLSASSFSAGGSFESPGGLNFVFGDALPAFQRIKAAGGLEFIAIGPSANAAAWLHALNGKLEYGSVLKVYAPEFKNSGSLSFPTPIEINCLRFINADHLQAQGLTVKTQSFVNGAVGKLAHIVSQGGLDIVSQQTIDSKWGGVFARGPTSLTAVSGDVEFGAFVEGEKFQPPNVVLRKKCFGRVAKKTIRNPVIVARDKNGSCLNSQDTLTVKALRGNIYVDYGEVFSKKFIDLQALNLVRVCAGFVGGFGGGRVAAKRFEVKRNACHSTKYAIWENYKYKHHGKMHHKQRVAGYRTTYTDTSDAAWVLLHGGGLFLDVQEGYIFGSHVAADGWIRNRQNRVIYPREGALYALEERLVLALEADAQLNVDLTRHKLANFMVVNSPSGAPAWLKSRERVDFRDGNFTLSGSVQAPSFTFQGQSFYAENTSRTRTAALWPSIMGLMESLPLDLNGSGLIEHQGTQGPYSYAFRGELDETPRTAPPLLDPRRLMYMGRAPRNLRNVRFTLSPELAMTALMAAQGRLGLFNQPGWGGEAGLTDLAYRGQSVYGRNTATLEELSVNPLATMLVGILNARAKAASDLAQKTNAIQNAFINHGAEIDEVDFALVVPAKDQDPHANESGSVIGKDIVNVHAQGDATFLSSTVAATDIDVFADKRLRLETLAYQTAESAGNASVTQQHGCPAVQFIGENSARAIGRQGYAAIGLQAYSGEGGGVWGSTEGSAYSGPLNLKTTISETNKSRSKSGKKKTETTVNTSYQSLPTAYTSLGETTHVSSADHLNHQVGVTNKALGDINLEGGQFVGETQILKGSTSTAKKGSVRNSRCSSESGHVTPSVMQTPKAVNVNSSKTATFRGTRIQADTLNDNAPQTIIEEKKIELLHSASRKGWHGAGKAKTQSGGGQDIAAFSQIAAEKLRSQSSKPKPTDQLTLQGVQGRIRQADIRKRFVEKAAVLKSWQKTTGKRGGFSTPMQTLSSGPAAFLKHDPLAQSIIGFKDAKGGQDRFAAGLRLGVQGLQDFKGLNPASRYTSVSLGVGSSRTTYDETQAYPNDLEIGKLTVVSALWDHGEGAKLKAVCVIAEVDEFLSSPAKNVTSLTSTQKNGGISVNPMNWCSVSASVGTSRSRESRLIHDPASIDADYFFLRTNNAKVSGATLRAKVFDAVVRGNLTLESVLDEVKKSRQESSFSVSYCPVLGIPLADGRIAGQKDVEKWIAHTCKLIGTQQFYLRVGETFLKRSAQAGLEAEGPEAPKLALEDGREFYVRKVPGHDHACGFYAMESTRAWGTALLLEHAHDEKLRAMAAVELYNRALVDNLPASIRSDHAYQTRIVRHNAAFARRAPEAETAEHKRILLNYLQEKSVYERYIRFLAESRGIGVPGEMLEFSPGLAGVHAPCVLDGLAYLQKRNLKIYQTNADGLAELVHGYVYDDPAAETVHLHHTWYDENEQVGFRNHFNRLEPTAGHIHAARTVEEVIQETHSKRRTKLNVPLSSAVALGLEIDKLIRPEQYAQQGELSKEELEAFEQQRQAIQGQVEAQADADLALQDSIAESGTSEEEQRARLKEGRQILADIAKLEARMKGQGDAVLYDPETQKLRKVPVPLRKPQGKGGKASSDLADDARRLEDRIRNFASKNAAQDPFALGDQPSLGVSESLGRRLRDAPVSVQNGEAHPSQKGRNPSEPTWGLYQVRLLLDAAKQRIGSMEQRFPRTADGIKTAYGGLAQGLAMGALCVEAIPAAVKTGWQHPECIASDPMIPVEITPEHVETMERNLNAQRQGTVDTVKWVGTNVDHFSQDYTGEPALHWMNRGLDRTALALGGNRDDLNSVAKDTFKVVEVGLNLLPVASIGRNLIKNTAISSLKGALGTGGKALAAKPTNAAASLAKTKAQPLKPAGAQAMRITTPALTDKALKANTRFVKPKVAVPTVQARPQTPASVQQSHSNVGAEFGRRPKGHVRTNPEFVQDLATRAERKVKGTGMVAGTKKHTHAKKVLERHENIYGSRGLEAEKGWKGGRELQQGDPTKGSTRLDVYDRTNEVVYDYKFVQNPGKGLRSAQVRKIERQGPKDAKIVELNPVKPPLNE